MSKITSLWDKGKDEMRGGKGGYEEAGVWRICQRRDAEYIGNRILNVRADRQEKKSKAVEDVDWCSEGTEAYTRLA